MNGRLILTTLALSTAIAAPAAARPADVRVINTVTVTGTVGIDPQNNVVTIRETVPVAIQNAPAPAERVVLSTFHDLAEGENAEQITLFDVPAGKRFESESIQVNVNALPGQIINAQVTTRYAGRNHQGVLPIEVRDPGTFKHQWTFMEDFVAVADESVKFTVARSGGLEDTVNAHVTVVGKLVDLEAPAS